MNSDDTGMTRHDVSVAELHHVLINVRDMDTALEFFVGVLGMELDTQAVMRGPGITSLLGLSADRSGRQAFLRGPRSVGQVELVEWDRPGGHVSRATTNLGLGLISFGVPPETFDQLVARCRAADVKILGGPDVLDIPEYAPTRLVVVEGPEGVPVEFMAPARPEDMPTQPTT